jgi:hypothetical protein
MDSEQSEVYTSSIYEGDRTLMDTISGSFFNTDGLSLFTSDPPFCQQSLTSVPETDFIQQSAPSNLTRIRPDRTSEYILYEPMDRKEFVTWWLKTSYGRRPEGKTFNWDRTGHTSQVWKNFDQIASSADGLPKVRFRRCGKILDHPGHSKMGTNSMGRHWKGEKCRRAVKNATQPDIRRIMQAEVSMPLLVDTNTNKD